MSSVHCVQSCYQSSVKSFVKIVFCFCRTALLIVRAWRNWCNEVHNNLKHFITTNAYVCIEINAHSLIKFIELCSKRGAPHNFLITALSSQPCEKLFAQLRTMATTNQTVVNFTIKELTEKLKRIQMKLNIMYRNCNKINFPSIEKLKNRTVPSFLPSENDISNAVREAHIIACRELSSVGIQSPNFDATISQTYRNTLQFVDVGALDSDAEDSGDINILELSDPSNVGLDKSQRHPMEFVEVSEPYLENECQIIHEVYDLEKILPNSKGEIKLTNCRTGNKHTFKVRDAKGNILNVKKEYLLYLLAPARYQLSTDRLARFRQKEFAIKPIQ